MKHLFIAFLSANIFLCSYCQAETSAIPVENQAFFAIQHHLNPQVLKLALQAYDHAIDQGDTTQNLLTIVDYSLPSNERRLWVLDLAQQRVLFHTLVAHGKNSGRLMAKQFSNGLDTLKSNIGTLLTGKTYWGQHRYSLQLRGLEKGFNDHASMRHIVMHGAQYVSQAFVEAHGAPGTSWGCLALDKHLVRPIIDTIKNGTLVFLYYPDQRWLTNSAYLQQGSTV